MLHAYKDETYMYEQTVCSTHFYLFNFKKIN